MRILIISITFAPELIGNAPLVTGLATDLAKQGHQVTVMTGFPQHGLSKIPDMYKRKIFLKENFNGVRVVRCYTYVSAQKSFFKKMLGYISFPLSSIMSSLIAGEYDIIFTLSPPLWLGLSAYFIGKTKGTPFIYNVQDLFPEAAIKLGVLRNKYAIYFFETLERFVYTQAKCVTVICNYFRDNIVKKGIPTHKVIVIPNWVDTDFIHPMEKNNEFRKENDIGDRFVILYSGAIGFSQPLEIVLECAKFMANNPEILFVIVGSGIKKEQLQKRAEQMSLKNIKFFDSQPRSKLSALLASADVSLVMLKTGIATVSLPSKIYGIMASGRPIIASLDKNSDAWNIIKEANCGLWVEPENSEKLIEAIEILYQNRELCVKYGANGRKYVIENNSRTKITAKYEQLLTSLIR